ncbi:Fc.00g060740.m01.CDS01 [Cosmosporella sp. VM-42]
MAFDIGVPLEKDAASIATTHLRAMGDNELLRAKFPDVECLKFLSESLVKDTLEHIADNEAKCILVARDRETGKIASFIKWLVQKQKTSEADQAQEEEQWPSSSRKVYANSYATLTTEGRRQVMGDKPHYHVTFLCTDPECSGRGAATMLLRQVLAKAAADNLPVVLESTMPAVSFYERLGFDIRRDLELMVPPQGSSEPTERYAEKVMVWTKK